MDLKQELDFYHSQKAELVKHYNGQFALVKEDKLIGSYTTWEEAFTSGVQQFGNVPFLIKLVQETEDVIQFPAFVVGGINANP